MKKEQKAATKAAPKVEKIIVAPEPKKFGIVTAFESTYRREHFRIGGTLYKFRNHKLNITDCTPELKTLILSRRTIKLSK